MTDLPADVSTGISESVTGLFLDKFGKGPMQVDTFVQGDVAVTIMRDVLTVAEQTMVASGRRDSVLNTRMLWQQATDHMFKAAVSEAAGRRVLTVISGFEVEQEMASEVFLFAPA